jgi:hypothetical protein
VRERDLGDIGERLVVPVAARTRHEVHPHLAELVPLRLRAVNEPEEGYPLAPE